MTTEMRLKLYVLWIKSKLPEQLSKVSSIRLKL